MAEPMELDEFRRQLRDALEHLYDPAHLEVHPLLAQVGTVPTADRLTRAQQLRGLLKDAVEALRPQRGSPSESTAWRSYLALRCRYVQGMSPGEVASELGLSLRQVQRELRKGLDALAAIVWQQCTTASPASTGQAPGLRNELNQWKLSRQSQQVQTLVDKTLWILKPVLAQHRATMQIDIPAALPPVLADSTLTLQALFQVVRLMAQSAPGNPIAVRAAASDRRVSIFIHSHSAHIDPADEDWQTAQLLVSQQGGMLVAEVVPQGGATVTLTLPQTGQTRVLVVDDNQAIHVLFERYLAPHCYEVLHAETGPQALRLAAEAQPDLITLDVMMPNVDGWQVLRQLTQDPATASIPILVCSVLREPELASALGASGYLKKPVDRLELLAALARLRSPAAPSAAAPRAAPPAQ